MPIERVSRIQGNGYWFQVAQDGVVTVNMVGVEGNSAANDGNTSGVATDDLEGSADYSGKALGLSVYKTFTGGQQTSISSGEFTADVELQATFGADAMLKGTIDNFQGNAVGTGWTVSLEEKEFRQPGETKGGGDVGAWATGTNGAADARPTGIFGTFNAHFSNGHAAGGYATQKD